MTPFVGRKRELQQLKELLNYKTAALVVVKGRRRIGKSRLIEEFAKHYQSLVITGLAPSKKVTAKHQREDFARQLSRAFKIPLPSYADWSDLFWQLAQQISTGRFVILLDEISWMGSKDPTFLAKLKSAWDLSFKKNSKLILVLCGSVSTWIEKNILSSTGFIGRIDLTLTLKELSLKECDEFWGKQKERISAYEKLKVLAVTGGIPRYLELISYTHNAEYNIKRLCFVKEGVLFGDFEKIFNDLFTKRAETYKAILLCLIQKPQAELNDIFQCMKIKKTGVISSYLEDLITSGFVQRDYAWSIKTMKKSKLSCFRISDNYIRFYLKYIYPNKDKISRDAYANRALTTLPAWDSIMGLQFENLIFQNRQLIQAMLHIDPAEIVYDNPYFQRRTKTQEGCQIDYMIQTKFNSIYPCEIKFSKQAISSSIVDEMKEKINKLTLPKNFSYRPVLIHVNGVDDSVIASEYFANIINFSEIF